MNNTDEHQVEVRNPERLGADKLPAERIALGGGYKPCIMELPSGELRVIAFKGEGLPDKRFRENMLLFRSHDGGMTWSDAEIPDLRGREPYFSLMDDGTIFISAHMHPGDIRTPVEYTHSYLHRSDDGGHTWQSIVITTDEQPGAPEVPKWILSGRNVQKLADGSIIFGMDVREHAQYLWRSHDSGRTWDRSLQCTFEGEGPTGPTTGKAWWPSGIAEAVYWQARNGDLLGIFRVEPDGFPPILGTEIVERVNDQVERLVVFRSTDGGKHWTQEDELGSYYGEMYPAVLRLQDGRLMMTFTVRAVREPLGVHAVLGKETDNGFEFDFEQDRIVLDAKTPIGGKSGGGFGPTIQLNDGTLVTAHSYRGLDGEAHIEVVRWRLPSF